MAIDSGKAEKSYLNKDRSSVRVYEITGVLVLNSGRSIYHMIVIIIMVIF